MSHDWERFGAALQAARETKGVTQAELGKLVGVSRSTVQAIERGKPFVRPTPTVRALARAVDWTDDSVEAVLAGGEPTPLQQAAAEPHATPQALPANAAGLPVRIADEIDNKGALVDTAVIPLGGGGNMVVVVKGAPNASPDQIRKNLETWRRIQGLLQEIDGGDESGTTANEG